MQMSSPLTVKPSTHRLRREVWSGGGASCWGGSLPFPAVGRPFPFPLVIHCHLLHRKLPGVAFKILPGSPEIAGAVAPAISGFSGPALGCPYGASQTHVNFFRAPDGLYFPGMRACVCVPMYLHISTRNLDVLGVLMTILLSQEQL